MSLIFILMQFGKGICFISAKQYSKNSDKSFDEQKFAHQDENFVFVLLICKRKFLVYSLI